MRRLCALFCGLLLHCSVNAQKDQMLLGDTVGSTKRSLLLKDNTWDTADLLGEAPPAKTGTTEPQAPDQAHPQLNHTDDAFNGSQPQQPPPLNDTIKTSSDPPPLEPDKTSVALAETLETETQQAQVQADAAMEAKTTSAVLQWITANMQTGMFVAVGGLALVVAGMALRARSTAKEQQAKQQREDRHLLESLLYNDMDYAAM